MSFIETDGRSPRFLTRAQKWAITNESAPSSSKKWLSTDTRSTRRTSASTSAKMLSAPVVAALPRSSISMDSATAHARSRNSTAASGPSATCSSHGLLEEGGQALLLPARDRLVLHPRTDRGVENPHAERRENDRTTTSQCRHPIMMSAGGRAGAKAVPPRNRVRRDVTRPTGVDGKFYMHALVISTRYAPWGAPAVSGRLVQRDREPVLRCEGDSQLGIRRSSAVGVTEALAGGDGV